MLLGVFWDVLHTTSYPRDDWCACALHACVRACVRACMYVFVRAYLCECACVCMCVCVYTYTRADKISMDISRCWKSRISSSQRDSWRGQTHSWHLLSDDNDNCAKRLSKTIQVAPLPLTRFSFFLSSGGFWLFPLFPLQLLRLPAPHEAAIHANVISACFFIFPRGFGCFMRGGGDMVPPKMADKCGSDLDYGRMWHYIWRRLMTWERVTSRMDESRDIWMRFVICAWMIYVTYPGVIANLWHGRRYCWGCAWVMSHMKGSCYIWMCHYRGCFWGVWMWKSHVTYGCNIAGAAVRGVNQSCHMWRRHVTYGCNMAESDVGGVNESCHTLRDRTIYRCIIAEGAVGGVDESCYIWKVGDIWV